MRSRFLALGLLLLIGTLLISAGGCFNSGADSGRIGFDVGEGDEKLIIYSGRKIKLFQPVIEAFNRETGIAVQVKNGKTAELAQAILEEKNRPQADVFLSQEAGILDKLRRLEVLQPYKPEGFENVAPDFRAPDGSWIGVSGRARVIIYNTDLVSEDDLPDSVFDLTSPEWKDRIAMASSLEASVVGWVSSLRTLVGATETEKFLKGLTDNNIEILANHSLVRKAVGKGEFAAGFVNHYYYHLEKATGSPVGVIYPDQGTDDVGVLVNAAGAAIIKGAKNQDNAKMFMDFLIDSEAQDLFARENFEYPTIEEVDANEALSLDEFKRSPVDLIDLGDKVDSTIDMLFDHNIL